MRLRHHLLLLNRTLDRAAELGLNRRCCDGCQGIPRGTLAKCQVPAPGLRVGHTRHNGATQADRQVWGQGQRALHSGYIPRLCSPATGHLGAPGVGDREAGLEDQAGVCVWASVFYALGQKQGSTGAGSQGGPGRGVSGCRVTGWAGSQGGLVGV